MGEETEVRRTLGVVFGEDTLVRRALRRFSKKPKRQMAMDLLELLGRVLVSGPVVSMIGALFILMLSAAEEEPRWPLRPIEGFENQLLRFRYALRGSRLPPPQVVIVAIDEASMAKLGRWPWPRVYFARLLEKLKEQDPAVVAFDVLFIDREDASKDVALRASLAQLEESLKSAALDEPQRANLVSLRAAVEKSLELSGGDQAMADAMAALEPRLPILSVKFSMPGSSDVLDPGTPVTAEQIQNLQFSALSTASEGSFEACSLKAPLADRVYYPVEALANFPVGHVTVIQDADSALRHLDVAFKFKGNLYPTLSLATLMAYYNAIEVEELVKKGRDIGQIMDSDLDLGDRSSLKVTYQGGNHLFLTMGKVKKKVFPLDTLGRTTLNFYGRSATFRYVSFVDVLEGKIPKGALKDKILLIGSTTVGAYDHYPTVFSGHFPGVEIHATFLGNALEDSFITKVEWVSQAWVGYYIGGTLIVAAFIGWSVRHMRALLAVLIVLLLMGAWVWFAFDAFNRNLQVHAATPLVAIIGTLGVALTRRAVGEERERRRLKKIFQPYVSPELLQVLLNNPNLLKLGGERRIATVLFSDVAGFTSMSEKLKPPQLVLIMNEYLGEMTRSITASGGFTDKYIGDGIMADFGIPVPHEDHAARACRSAVDQMERLKGLNVRFKERDLPVLKVRVGIHTGELTAGNFGSEERMNFTVMGDAVNLAARLEGVNKEYGTSIIVSEDTFRGAHAAIEARELDLVRVVGRANPEAIYEVIGLKGQADPKRLRAGQEYERGLGHYRDRSWDDAIESFKAGLEVDPDDGPCKVLLKRCEEYKSAPPPDNWEGVYDLTHK